MRRCQKQKRPVNDTAEKEASVSWTFRPLDVGCGMLLLNQRWRIGVSFASKIIQAEMRGSSSHTRLGGDSIRSLHGHIQFQLLSGENIRLRPSKGKLLIYLCIIQEGAGQER